MTMDLETAVTNTAGYDYRWLGSRAGFEGAQRRTLDVSRFIKGRDWQTDTSTLLAGVAIGRVGTSNLYGPYDPDATDGRQNLDSFLLHNYRLLRWNGDLTLRIIASATVHAVIKPERLPLDYQRSTVATAPTGGLFAFETA